MAVISDTEIGGINLKFLKILAFCLYHNVFFLNICLSTKIKQNPLIDINHKVKKRKR